MGGRRRPGRSGRLKRSAGLRLAEALRVRDRSPMSTMPRRPAWSTERHPRSTSNCATFLMDGNAITHVDARGAGRPRLRVFGVNEVAVQVGSGGGCGCRVEVVGECECPAHPCGCGVGVLAVFGGAE